MDVQIQYDLESEVHDTWIMEYVTTPDNKIHMIKEIFRVAKLHQSPRKSKLNLKGLSSINPWIMQ